MKLLIFLAAVSAIHAAPEPEFSSLYLDEVEPPSGGVDQPDESRSAPVLTSNLSPEALTPGPDTEYHGPMGVPEAGRIKAAEESPGARIVGGLASYVGEHPFVGGLVITLQSGQTSVCGSSLLTSSRVVTAAHCWYDGVDTAYSMLVVLGSVRLFSGGVRVYASSVYAHAQYSPGVRTNDIALLAIPSVSYSSAVKPIAIATGSATYDGYVAEAIGFGRTTDTAPITEAASLRDVFVNVISNAVCQSYYGSVVTPGIICTSGSGGRNPCGGDSGGPLILYSSAGNDVLIGIINFISSSGCQSGNPGGYVRVSYHAQWLINNV